MPGLRGVGGGSFALATQSKLKDARRLSGSCASRLSKVADLAKECEGDVKNLCGGSERAAEALDCIKSRLGEVSKRCKDALAKVAVPFAFFQ
jgi:hypothetical protein